MKEDNQIRIPVADPGDKGEKLRTITISEKDQIQAVYSNDRKTIVSYIFGKTAWTEETAGKWIQDHGKSFGVFEGSLEIKEVKTEGGSVFVEGYASTFDLDRDMEIVDKNAFNETMAEYMKNPIVLVGHVNAPENVVGTVEKFKIDDVGLWVRIKLVTPVTDFLKQVVANVQDGILRAFSIGGIFEKINNIIAKVNLMEISIVPIPANANCIFSLAKACKAYKGGEAMVECTDEEKIAKIEAEISAKAKEVEDLKKRKPKKPKVDPPAPDPAKEDPPPAEPVKEDPPAEDPPADPPAEEPKKEDPPAEDPPAEGAGDPPAEDPPAGDPPAEDQGEGQDDNGDKSGKISKKGDDEKMDEKQTQALIDRAVEAGVKSALEGIRKEARIEFPVGGELREGNLKIADRQLVDIMLKKTRTITLVNNEKKSFTFKGGLIEGAKGVAMDTAEAGGGQEWIPVEMATEMIDQIRQTAQTYGLFREVKPMPSSTFDVGIGTADPTFYLQGEATDDSTAKATSSLKGTGKCSLVAKKLGAKVPYSTEMDEDSAIALLPIIKDGLAQAGASVLDNVVINGDTTGTHMDSDVTGATDARKAWKGLRKLAIAGSMTVDLSTFNADTLLGMPKKMGIYANSINDLAWIVSPKTVWGKLFTLRDSQNNAVFLSVDKYGQDAVNVKGELGKMFGIPVIISDNVREDVNASGVYDGTTTDKSTILLVRRGYFLAGEKRGLTYRVDYNQDRDQDILTVTMRKAFVPVRTPSTTISSVCAGYNFAP